jgi:hypothetical protein
MDGTGGFSGSETISDCENFRSAVLKSAYNILPGAHPQGKYHGVGMGRGQLPAQADIHGKGADRFHQIIPVAFRFTFFRIDSGATN